MGHRKVESIYPEFMNLKDKCQFLSSVQSQGSKYGALCFLRRRFLILRQVILEKLKKSLEVTIFSSDYEKKVCSEQLNKKQ